MRSSSARFWSSVSLAFAITAMEVSGITWKGQSIEDIEMLREFPADVVRVLSDTNGFILRRGAVPSEKVMFW